MVIKDKRVIDGIRVTVDIDVNDYEASGGDEGRLFLANEARRLMDPYVPAQNMMLSSNVDVYVENGVGKIAYNSPYAHYQYMGEVYGPNIPIKDQDGNIVRWYSPPHKMPTGRPITYSAFRHPLATHHWDRAMMVARGEDLARAYQAWLKGRTT